MLFNSYSFLFAFLPIALAGFFLAGRFGKEFGAAWLAACSIFFYAYWDHRYVPLLLASIVGNFLAGKYIAAHAGTRAGKITLAAAVAGNLLILGYYKYADFFVSSANAALGSQWPLLGIVLPIGISFFTFTQIAFLADAYAGLVKEYRFVNYLLFVTYFPHLIAGPVLHHREMMPQFDEARTYAPRFPNFGVGITIFAIGLAKKTLIADNLAGYANAVFDPAAPPPSFFVAWGGVLAYTFQLYFDFSGYSDMAIGLARMFGTRLPLNFNSPYKAANIAEFWRRWHMTLSRFLRDYLYIPLGGNRSGTARRHVNLMATMLLGGLWHGAGWGFVIWGALHGIYLVVHNAWRHLRSHVRLPVPGWLGRPCAVALTFMCVAVAWVYFRAPDLATAHRILGGLAGTNGVQLPEAVATRLGALWPVLSKSGVTAFLGGGATFAANWTWILAAAAIAFALPNTQELMRRAAPAFDWSPLGGAGLNGLDLVWRPSTLWAVLSGMLLALGILSLSQPTEFLYFQF